MISDITFFFFLSESRHGFRKSGERELQRRRRFMIVRKFLGFSPIPLWFLVSSICMCSCDGCVLPAVERDFGTVFLDGSLWGVWVCVIFFLWIVYEFWVLFHLSLLLFRYVHIIYLFKFWQPNLQFKEEVLFQLLEKCLFLKMNLGRAFLYSFKKKEAYIIKSI